MFTKKNLLLALISLSFGFTTTGERPDAPKQKYYYFCQSREVPPKEGKNDKLQFIYTDVHEVVGDETDIRRLTSQFASFISKQCKPGNEMCTSDLNYYPDLQQAKKRYKETVAKYERAGQYTVKRIDFKFE